MSNNTSVVRTTVKHSEDTENIFKRKSHGKFDCTIMFRYRLL